MRSSKKKLQSQDFERYRYAEPALLRDLADVVCHLGIMPEKELLECWQLAKVIHASFPKILHVVDLAAGNGLLSWILVLLANNSEQAEQRTAVSVDINRSKAAELLSEAFKQRWPGLDDLVYFVEGSLDSVVAKPGRETLFVANHACGSLSDRVLLAAVSSGSSVALMPCCHSLRNQGASLGALAEISNLTVDGVESTAVSIDRFRADVLLALGYEVAEGEISREITAFRRVILGVAPTVEVRGPTSEVLFACSAKKRQEEIRAYEKIETFDVTDWENIRQLSKAPSREWRRFFDLCVWISREDQVKRLQDSLQTLSTICTFETEIIVLDRYKHPSSERMSVTYRVHLSSLSNAITKDDATSLRSRLVEAIETEFSLRN